MATIEQYKSGEAAKAVRMAFEAMKDQKALLPETQLAALFLQNAEALAPMALDEAGAFEFIEKATKCALGDRVCNRAFPESPHTCAVFLGELADAMVESGQAEYVSPGEAKAALAEHRGKPLVISKVSGQYAEICRTWPENCFYWNLEKRGLKCIRKGQNRT